MIQTLLQFTQKSLFEATSSLLNKLGVEFDRETAEPIDLADLYDGPMPAYLTDALTYIDNTYFVGVVNDLSLAGNKSQETLDEITDSIHHGGKYDGMFVFACDAKHDANLTRTTASALTRALNRIAAANPVILVIRQGTFISLATCERTNYTQEWRNGGGEKLGKVTILRNINCEKPHRGHVDILDSLAKRCTTFDEMYSLWMNTFSNDVLTKKFYNELSDWYAWAVQIAKFPNDITTEEDDAKFNHESCIRLITRLIFVWFIKQKGLIPNEYFDEEYIKENFIDGFNPHDRKNLYYNPEDSKYYRAIIQNLFFATLNCPIVAEGKTTPNNRRFRKKTTYQGKNNDYNINNLMRYEDVFMDGGAQKFIKLANKHVPFLNGGLFDCLDEKRRGMYYDGFSEHPKSLEQLYLPDWMFFGEEVGNGIDLSEWYGDKKKKHVSARGIIDILNRYTFTVEENTPLDQEVSLDPELLGKVFENLLASFNPETKQSARKQTGSFYTPREIVQYMVDESLVAHLKRKCGDENEAVYRSLLSYDTDCDTIDLTTDQRREIMDALYNCKVLDPACGSGAFPMGVLQQMVHVLKKLDPTNEVWQQIVTDNALEQSRKAFSTDNEDERNARLDDIKQAFNTSINDPDYARKLYLVEHCIYGVDIQPIATQISKLRFFISLVVDQRPTKDAGTNFGIRPLPNLEAKFVTANTLIPFARTAELTIEDNDPDIISYKQQLQDYNHRMFATKKSTEKEDLRQKILNTRKFMAVHMENQGYITSQGCSQLMAWDMFNQNASSPFFDPEWMFGVKDGFDVVIGNPPYGASLTNDDKKTYRKIYPETQFKIDTYSLFVLASIKFLTNQGISYYIIPNTLLDNYFEEEVRKKLLSYQVVEINDLSDKVFETAVVHSMIFGYRKSHKNEYDIRVNIADKLYADYSLIPNTYFLKQSQTIFSIRTYGSNDLLDKIKQDCIKLFDVLDIRQAIKSGNDKLYITSECLGVDFKPILRGKDVRRYSLTDPKLFIFYGKHLACPRSREIFEQPKILIREAGANITATYDDKNYYIMSSLYNAIIKDNRYSLKYLLALINSKLFQYLMYKLTFEKTKGAFTKAKIFHYYELPVKVISKISQEKFVQIVSDIIELEKQNKSSQLLQNKLDKMIFKLYLLDFEEVLLIDPETPFTREEYDNFQID